MMKAAYHLLCVAIIALTAGCGEVYRTVAPDDVAAPAYDQPIGVVHAAVVRALIRYYDRVTVDDHVNHIIETNQKPHGMDSSWVTAHLTEANGITTVAIVVESNREAIPGWRMQKILDRLTLEMSRPGVAK